ncbi:MAG TPA: hypothetical protein VM737_02855 [Gemmatimonadota bacterium]|nr:hypothetical protein [Gemmatimonadota bacterium]
MSDNRFELLERLLYDPISVAGQAAGLADQSAAEPIHRVTRHLADRLEDRDLPGFLGALDDLHLASRSYRERSGFSVAETVTLDAIYLYEFESRAVANRTASVLPLLDQERD